MSKSDSSVHFLPDYTIPRYLSLKTEEKSRSTAKALGDTWWQTSPVACRNGAIPLYTALPPYNPGPNTRVADFLGITSQIIDDFFEASGLYCPKCKKLSSPESPSSILRKLKSPYYCITAASTLEHARALTFPRIVLGNQCKLLEELESELAPTLECEIVLDRIKIGNEKALERTRNAIKSGNEEGLHELAIRHWPVDEHRYPLANPTRCSNCGSPYQDREKMQLHLDKELWRSEYSDVPGLRILTQTLENYPHHGSAELKKFGLGKIHLDTPFLSLPLDQQHLMAIANCLKKKSSRFTAVISPLRFCLSPSQLDTAISALKNSPPGGTFILGTQTTRSKKVGITPNLPELLESGSLYHLLLQDSSKAAIHELQKQLQESSPKDYKTHTCLPETAPASEYSMVATASNCFTALRQLYAKLPEARMEGLTATDFGLSPRGFRCHQCAGRGGNCMQCAGSRYHEKIEMIRFNRTSLPKLLQLSIDKAFTLMERIPQIANPLSELRAIGLGRYSLGTPLYQLNCSELFALQIMKLLNSKGKKSSFMIVSSYEVLSQDQQEYLMEKAAQLTEKGAIVVLTHRSGFSIKD